MNNWLHDATVETATARIEREQSEALTAFRAQRDAALVVVDKHQGALRYAELTAGQQTELAAYRLALLDAPESMVMPAAPAWLV